MADDTLISWADKTHNHWIGCMKVGPGCDGCYAEHLMDTRLGRVTWGAPGVGVGTRALTSEVNRRKPLAWNRQAAKDGTRPFVFCSSLADVFDNQVPLEWRAELFALIAATPNLTWLLLTKRPRNIVDLFDALAGVLDDDVYRRKAWPANAAIGCTVVNQEEADRDVPVLLAAKAALNPAFAFLSMEPLLGPVDLTRVCILPKVPDSIRAGIHLDSLRGRYVESGLAYQGDWDINGPAPTGPAVGLDWVITGGETDQGKHKARPSNPQWFRDLRDQCAAAGVAFHHKQNGEWASVSEVEGPGDHFTFPDHRSVRRVGKKRAGRLIDGREHNARPGA